MSSILQILKHNTTETRPCTAMVLASWVTPHIRAGRRMRSEQGYFAPRAPEHYHLNFPKAHDKSTSRGYITHRLSR